MSRASALTNPGASPSAPEIPVVATAVQRLQAEYDAAPSAVSQALLLHEIAVLEERLGDEAESIRDHLGASDAEPSFHEPLERLARVVAHRQPSRLAGKLLERLSRIAEGPSERARAFLEYAAHLADLENDLDGARAALEKAAEATPGDPAVWLSLEFLAGRAADPALAERALAERAELAEKPALRALLLVDLGERLLERGEVDAALRTLERAAESPHEFSYGVSRALERLGMRAERPDVVSDALDAQAKFVLSAVRDPASGDAVGVPETRRALAEATDAWLRAAELSRKVDPDRAAELLDRALEVAPDSLLLARARVELFDALGDGRGAETFLRARLERGGVPASLAAALWVRLARAADAEGDRARARDAVERALELSPEGIPARALEIEWCSAESDTLGLARALERAAAISADSPSKANAYLALADLRGRKLGATSEAEAALSQALEAGARAERVLGVGRLIAAANGDAAFDERVARLTVERLDEASERAAVHLELARAAARRGDGAEMQRDLERLAATPSLGWLGRVLGAYGAAVGAQSGADAAKFETALSALSDTESDQGTARALRLVLALRALRRGATDVATQALVELNDAAPGDLVAAGALSTLLCASNARAQASDVLAAAAEQQPPGELSAALELSAGVLAWRSNRSARAIENFEHAAGQHPAGSHLLSWALSASQTDGDARRRALDALAASAPDLAALERFALEVGRDEDPEAATAALEALRAAENEELRRAGYLAAALFGSGEQGANSRRDALDALAEWGPPVERLARAVAHQLELVALGPGSTPDAERTRVSSARWARSDPGVAPVLEWLATAVAAHDVVDEVAARRALAERLTNGSGAAILASAALAAELGGLDATFAPESGSPAARLVELELSPPGRDPGRRARALDRASPLLGEDAAFTALVLAGYNQLAARDANAALVTFRRAVEELPEEVVGWEGLRAAALAAGDRGTLAEACAALGDAVSDGALGARLWEEAATILLDELDDPERGEFALTRAVDRDVTRLSAFQRAFRAIRARKDHAQLIELIDRRLGVADEPAELVKLLWERARSQRELGDREGARRTLEQVQALDPDHVGALALAGEIHIALGRFGPAAESLARLSQSPAAPAEQRLMSGVAAADVFETRLAKPERAFDVLHQLEQSGLANLVARERLARTAVKSERYVEAVDALEQLMRDREDSEGRAAAARLATAIYREKLGRPAAAERAVTALLAEVPDDPEGLDLVLSGVLDPALGDELLERGLGALVRRLEGAPFDRDNVERLARVCAELGLAARRQAALGVLVALGADKSRVDPELWALDRNVEHGPQAKIDESALPHLTDPEDHGPVSELARLLDPTLTEALGPNLNTLGVGRRERVDARAGTPLRAEIAIWAQALGIDEFELYVGGPDPEGVVAVGNERPALVVGSAISAPLTPRQRQAVARALFAVRRSITALVDRDPFEVRSIVGVACRLGEVEPPYPASVSDAEFQRRIQRELPRKIRRVLPELARRVVGSGQDPVAWWRAARGTLDRLGLLAAGDVSWVLAETVAERGHEPATDEAAERARRLLAFALSDAYLELRESLGMGVR
jgi:tetratricopeptide (TPR) repeat protein